ncbi:MAG: hypothetical protein EZS28_035538 [Streblomastix strix]|uniref:OTU domain-containing protein n=1 Tax=Streblomastix strix TaxID=222440 RepID=A0A5J4UHB1_9EUKA|nr:MAG: hypothetical protein EZS28_035538 [Streblomastix strix]
MLTRSKNSKQGNQRRQRGFGLVELLIAYLLLHPGQTTIASREFGITTQQTYTIARCYCRQTSFKNDSLRMPSYITRERELRLAQNIHQRILNREALTVDDVRQEIINQHIQERRNASTRAEKLGLFSLVNEFRSCLPEPSSQYIFNFVHRHNITFSLQPCQEMRRFEASFSSNIVQWFRCVYQPTISTGVRARSVFNMDETSVNWDIQQRTAKQVGTRRGICIPSDNGAGHISMVPTISPGSHQPPTLFIIGLLKKVPETLLQLPAAEDCQFDVSDSGFMNLQLFRRWTRMFCEWIRQQKRCNYFQENERILLFLDGHKSRMDETASQLLTEEGVTAIIFPGALTHILQPLDSIVFKQFRSQYKKQLLRQTRQMNKNKIIEQQMQKKSRVPSLEAFEKRLVCVQAAIDAYQMASTSSNRISSFECTGIWPRVPDRASNRNEVTQDNDAPVFPNGRSSGLGTVSATILTAVKRKRDLQTEDEIETNQNQSNGIKRRRENTSISVSNQTIESIKDAIPTATKYVSPSAKLPPVLLPKEFIESLNKRPYKKNNKEKAKSNIQTDLVLLTEQLEKDGLTIRNNRGAGNCLFHALNDQLGGIFHDVHILRTMIVQNLLEHAEQFREFFDEDESLEEYAERMRADGEWGDGRLFGSIAQLFNTRIEIYIPGEPLFSEGDSYQRTARLGFIGNCHYVSIRA